MTKSVYSRARTLHQLKIKVIEVYLEEIIDDLLNQDDPDEQADTLACFNRHVTRTANATTLEYLFSELQELEVPLLVVVEEVINTLALPTHTRSQILYALHQIPQDGWREV